MTLQAKIDALDKHMEALDQERRQLERERELAFAQLHPPLFTSYPDLPETRRVFS